MIRLILLLLGADFVRRRWPVLMLLGLVWSVLGVALAFDAFADVITFPLRGLGYVLLFEGILTLIAAASKLSLQTRLRYVKGLMFVLIAGLIIDPHPQSDVVLAILFGTNFLVGGCLQIAAARVIQFKGWRTAMWVGVFQLLIAVLFYSPYPLHYAGTVPFSIALSMMISGVNLVWLANRLRKLPHGAAILSVWGGNSLFDLMPEPALDDRARHALVATDWYSEIPLVVHVWTPVGSAKSRALRRPIVDRYIAAVDSKGVISTGHAALEVNPDLYISLYPAQEIDRSPAQFARLLRASAENDICGRFLHSYPEEAQAWCDSTVKVAYRRYNHTRLRAFWLRYQQDATYNLTNRNCSSTVSAALEAALEGELGTRASPWRALAFALVCPELWVAGQIYRRAKTMTWTPGMTLDYARALRIVVHPPPVAWLMLLRLALRARRRYRDRERQNRLRSAVT